jgi:hypothetical protein
MRHAYRNCGPQCAQRGNVGTLLVMGRHARILKSKTLVMGRKASIFYIQSCKGCEKVSLWLLIRLHDFLLTRKNKIRRTNVTLECFRGKKIEKKQAWMLKTKHAWHGLFYDVCCKWHNMWANAYSMDKMAPFTARTTMSCSETILLFSLDGSSAGPIIVNGVRSCSA